MVGLFKRKPAPAVAEALPLSVESALCGLTVVCRPDAGDASRVLLQWANDAGACSWHHTPEETRRRLAEAFPGLTPGQLDLACRAVAGQVRAAQVEQGQAKTRSTWASWRPAWSLDEL